MEIISGLKVIHKQKRVVETIVDKCKIKIDGKWVDGIIYKGTDRFTGKPMTFVRELSDFNNEFEIIESYGL